MTLKHKTAIAAADCSLFNQSALRYLSGFCNDFATEALADTLPVGQNSPQRVAHGLYAEQISGTAFTAPREANRRSWVYRIRPGAVHSPFKPYSNAWSGEQLCAQPEPNPMRWDALPVPSAATDFIDSWRLYAGNGAPQSMAGCAIYLYCANESMGNRYFYNGDGELLIVPQEGRLGIKTEFGLLSVEPQEMVVIPRGCRFNVTLLDAHARGYICENYGALLKLPDLGPIGSNGLALSRDFETPVAWFEDTEGDYELIAKFQGALWRASLGHAPCDVVAWHGNYAPYKYDMRRFNTIGTISFDHPDPSLFLVLHSPSYAPGVDDIDFVIFPPRWLVAENTFRPPWFHRNVASEFMGLVHGQYDAKSGGFVPGGASLHNCMVSHGPDADTFEKASNEDTSQPRKVTDTLAFMFETRAPLLPSNEAVNSTLRQSDYYLCWQGLTRHFTSGGTV
ncbi:MAG: homogentisate 1,2-dioxygenase [Pusillimonas sp.]|nr:homogentisate 1,2-dioxygenase [Pusillimonas sp.]